jgi:hypothetical protein
MEEAKDFEPQEISQLLKAINPQNIGAGKTEIVIAIIAQIQT